MNMTTHSHPTNLGSTLLWVAVLVALMILLCCGCKTSHGEHRTTTVGGGLFEYQNGTGDTKLFWMQVNEDK